MVEVTERIGAYLEQFSRFEKSPGVKDSWAHPLRQEAMQRFSERGLPDTNDEEWRFTSVAPLRETFEPAAGAARSPRAAEVLQGFRFEEGNAHQLVFVNGEYSEEYSSPGSLPRAMCHR